MKKIIILTFCTVGWVLNSNSLNFSNFHTNTINLSLQTDPPREVLTSFYNSFIVEEGEFRGAYIGKIKNYLEMPQIIELIKGKGFNLSKSTIFEGFKPKGIRGCKKKKNWVCQLPGTPVILD